GAMIAATGVLGLSAVLAGDANVRFGDTPGARHGTVSVIDTAGPEDAAWPSDLQASADGDTAHPGDRALLERAMPFVAVDEREHDRRQQHARRESPYYFEAGDAWVALDPEGDLRKTQSLVHDVVAGR
ncbi:MAG TPA: hypothetical protein VNU01_13290, partial [Egibacteraceae bacterium]|nr:hypothetical protein [Egibacteraceae bacterium]